MTQKELALQMFIARLSAGAYPNIEECYIEAGGILKVLNEQEQKKTKSAFRNEYEQNQQLYKQAVERQNEPCTT